MTTPESGKSTSHQRSETTRGVLWMMVAVAGFAAIVISVRAVKADIGVPQLLFLRAVIGLAVISAIMIPRHGWRRLITRRPGLQLVRNLCHMGAQYSIFFAVITVPLAIVTAIEYVIPAVTSVIAALTIGEKVARHRWIGMAASFAGVLLIVRPGFVDVTFATLMVLVGATLYSAQNVMVKVLTPIDGPNSIVFTMNAIQTVFLIGPAIYLWVTPDWNHVPWIAMLGLSGVITHYCISRALMLIDTSVCFPIDFLRLPFIAAIAYLVWGETFSAWTVLGAAIIFGSIYLSVRWESKAS